MRVFISLRVLHDLFTWLYDYDYSPQSDNPNNKCWAGIMKLILSPTTSPLADPYILLSTIFSNNFRSAYVLLLFNETSSKIPLLAATVEVSNVMERRDDGKVTWAYVR
jgi:hypothetical protein